MAREKDKTLSFDNVESLRSWLRKGYKTERDTSLIDNKSSEDLENEEDRKGRFDLYLNDYSRDKKIECIKIIRHATGLGLRESKNIVDVVPRSLIETYGTLQEAKNMKSKLLILADRLRNFKMEIVIVERTKRIK